LFPLIIGLVLMGISAFLFFQQRNLKVELFAMSATETSEVKILQQLAQEISDELGKSGGFRQQVEVKGRIRCEQYLVADISQKPCVYCETIIREEYEKTQWKTDNEGNMHQKTERGSATLSKSTRQVDFYVEDETGQILVSPDQAKVEGVKIYDQFHPADTIEELEISVGEVEIEFFPQDEDKHHTLGYTYQEIMLPVETQVYILGEVSDRDGNLQIHAPREENQPFLITHKSEEEVAQEKKKSVVSRLVWIRITLFLGVGLILFSVLNLLFFE